MEGKENNQVLNLPFDESKGNKAYDYSKSRADGMLSGGVSFAEGKQGNCVEFDGTGKVEVEKNVLNLSLPFSICAFIKVHELARTVSVVLNYAGINQYYESRVKLVAGAWYHIAVTYENHKINVYLNGTRIDGGTISATWGNPVGVSINQDCYNTEYAHGCVDNLKVYQYAFTQNEVQDIMDETKQLMYAIDGVDFKKYGVHVSGSKGLLDGLKMKEPKKVEFDGYHGVAVDLSRPRYEPREIRLECFINVDGGKMAFVQAVNSFVEQFRAKHIPPTPAMAGSVCPAGLHRLTVDIHPTKPLLYEVYLPDGIEVEKTWNDKRMIGTFVLKLIEPEPVKKILKHWAIEDAKQVSITLSTIKLVNIYWGDGTTTQDVYGDNITITHDYAVNGEYYIIITGVVEDIRDYTSNAILVWEKL